MPADGADGGAHGTGPPRAPLVRSCGVIRRLCFAFARWPGRGLCAWARPRPGRGTKGPMGALAVGLGPASAWAHRGEGLPDGPRASCGWLMRWLHSIRDLALLSNAHPCAIRVQSQYNAIPRYVVQEGFSRTPNPSGREGGRVCCMRVSAGRRPYVLIVNPGLASVSWCRYRCGTHAHWP